MFPVKDYPKIKSPFVREDRRGAYVVTPRIEPGYEWVFEDVGVMAVDKLHGTNVCVIIEDGIIKAIHNRTQILLNNPLLNLKLTGQAQRAIEGSINAMKHLKGKEGYVYGELIGPKINGNLHGLNEHHFVPFDYVKEKCFWKSWAKNTYPKTYEAISNWFRELPSLYTERATGKSGLAEGLIFYHPDGRKAKLRRDMFDWYHGV